MISHTELTAAIHEARSTPAALERLLKYYGPYLQLAAEYSIGHQLQRRESASDVVQKTLMEATAAIDQFRGESEPEFSHWIHQILQRNVANVVRDNFAAKRDIRREVSLQSADESAAITWRHPEAEITAPDVKVIKAEAALNLAHAIKALPEDQRLAIQMRHLEGASVATIAEAMNKTAAAVAGLLRRGMQSLREEFREDEWR